jgi:hypothetical protein
MTKASIIFYKKFLYLQGAYHLNFFSHYCFHQFYTEIKSQVCSSVSVVSHYDMSVNYYMCKKYISLMTRQIDVSRICDLCHLFNIVILYLCSCNNQSLNNLITPHMDYSKPTKLIHLLLMKVPSVLTLSFYHCGIHTLWINL